MVRKNGESSRARDVRKQLQRAIQPRSEKCEQCGVFDRYCDQVKPNCGACAAEGRTTCKPPRPPPRPVKAVRNPRSSAAQDPWVKCVGCRKTNALCIYTGTSLKCTHCEKKKLQCVDQFRPPHRTIRRSNAQPKEDKCRACFEHRAFCDGRQPCGHCRGSNGSGSTSICVPRGTPRIPVVRMEDKCRRCRQLKSRCSHEKPCESCNSKGIICGPSLNEEAFEREGEAERQRAMGQGMEYEDDEENEDEDEDQSMQDLNPAAQFIASGLHARLANRQHAAQRDVAFRHFLSDNDNDDEDEDEEENDGDENDDDDLEHEEALSKARKGKAPQRGQGGRQAPAAPTSAPVPARRQIAVIVPVHTDPNDAEDDSDENEMAFREALARSRRDNAPQRGQGQTEGSSSSAVSSRQYVARERVCNAQVSDDELEGSLLNSDVEMEEGSVYDPASDTAEEDEDSEEQDE